MSPGRALANLFTAPFRRRHLDIRRCRTRADLTPQSLADDGRSPSQPPTLSRPLF